MASQRKMAALLAMCETFAREMTEAGLVAYLSACDDMSDSDFEAATGWCLRNEKFFPPPAVLRAKAGKTEPSPEDAAIRAWAEAWAATADHGSYASVEFADPVTARTILAMGGWPTFCRPEQDVEWHRKEFLETYRSFHSVPAIRRSQPGRLVGLHEKAGTKPRVVPLIGGGSAVARGLFPAEPEQDDATVMRRLRDAMARGKSVLKESDNGDEEADEA